MTKIFIKINRKNKNKKKIINFCMTNVFMYWYRDFVRTMYIGGYKYRKKNKKN